MPATLLPPAEAAALEAALLGPAAEPATALVTAAGLAEEGATSLRISASAVGSGTSGSSAGAATSAGAPAGTAAVATLARFDFTGYIAEQLRQIAQRHPPKVDSHGSILLVVFLHSARTIDYRRAVVPSVPVRCRAPAQATRT